MADTEPSACKDFVLVSNVANNGAQVQDATPPPRGPSPTISLRPGSMDRNDGMKLTEIYQ